jgi:DNA processing protein
LITARFAAEQGREVFAVPGSPLDPRAEGTNDLLRNGATLCAGVEDVIEILAKQIEGPQQDLFSGAEVEDPGQHLLWDELEMEACPPRQPSNLLPPVDDLLPLPQDTGIAIAAVETTASVFDRVVDLLGPAPISIDELVRSSAAPARDVRSVLFELELAGRLARHGGDLVSLL